MDLDPHYINANPKPCLKARPGPSVRSGRIKLRFILLDIFQLGIFSIFELKTTCIKVRIWIQDKTLDPDSQDVVLINISYLPYCVANYLPAPVLNY